MRALGEKQAADAAVLGFGARRQRSERIAYVLLYRTREGRQRFHTVRGGKGAASRAVGLLGGIFNKTGLSVQPSEAVCEILRGQDAGEPEAFVFRATRGEGVMGASLGYSAASCRPPDRHPTYSHVLRHSFASLAANLGYSEPTIATMIGHQGRCITSRRVHAADAVAGRIVGFFADED